MHKRENRSVSHYIARRYSPRAHLFPILASQEDFTADSPQVRSMSGDKLIQIPTPLFRECHEFRPWNGDTLEMTEGLQLAHKMYHLRLYDVALVPYSHEVCKRGAVNQLARTGLVLPRTFEVLESPDCESVGEPVAL
jgi:hypothetical protein